MKNATILYGFSTLLALALLPGTGFAVGTISGTVTNATGTPLQSAYVTLQQPGTYLNYYDYSDGSGYYEITNVPAGSYWVRASVSGQGLMGQYYGGVTFESEDPTYVDVTDGNTTANIDISCPDGFFISGTLTDRDTSDPINSAYVDAFRKTGESLWWGPYTYSDNSGYYRLSGLPAGDIFLTFDGDGYIETYYNDRLLYDDADPLVLDGISNLTGVDASLRPGGNILTAVMDSNGLPPHNPGVDTILDNTINDIAEDPSSNLWFATDSGVMGIISGVTQAWHPYNSNLPTDGINALSIDGSGNRYYATEGGFVRHNTNDTMDTFTMANSTLYSENCTAVLANIGGNTWIGTDEGILFRYNGVSTFTDYDSVTRGEPSPSSITDLAYRSNVDKIYIGTGTGLTVYDVAGNSFSRLTTADGLPSNSIQCLDAAADGTLWVGTSSGVYVIAPGGSTTDYDTGDGLPSSYIQDVHVLNTNRAWVATNSGIALFDTGTFTSYTTADGLSTGSRTAILEADGQTYMGSSFAGFDILSGSTFRQVLKDNFYMGVVARNVDTGDVFSNSTNVIPLTIGGMPTGNYTLYLNNFNFPRKYYDDVYVESQATAIAVTEGATTAQRYAMLIGEFGGMSGNATDAGASPLTSGTITFHPVSDLSNTKTASVSGGTYSTDSLTPGDYYVSLYQSPNAAVFYPGVLKLSDAGIVTVTSGMTTTGIDLQLQNTTDGSLAGRVLDQNGNPYPHTSVQVRGAVGTSGTLYLTTDRLGNFTTDLTPGNYTAYANLAGLPSVYHASTFDQDMADIVGVGNGEDVTGVNITVPSYAPGTISGIVVDNGGNPLSDATVQLSGFQTFPEIQTQPDGTFALTDLPPYSAYYLDAEAASRTSDGAGPLNLSAGGNIGPVTLTLASYTPATLSGVIRDASGNRTWGANIYLDHQTQDYFSSISSTWDGSFEFANVPAGDVELEVNESGYDNLVVNLTLAAGANTRDITVTFDNSRGVIWGHTRDQGGQARPGIRVRLSGPGTYYHYSNIDGVFVAPNLTPGTYNVEGWSHPDEATPVNGVNAAAGPVAGNIDISHSATFGTVFGQVTRQSDSSLVPNPVVYASGSSYSYRYSDPAGNYALCGIEPGSLIPYADTEGFIREYYDGVYDQDDGQSIVIGGSDDVTGIDFVLDPGASVSGQVVDAYNRSLKDAYVYVRHPDTGTQKSARTDLHGNYTVAGILPGDNTARATRSQFHTTYYDGKPTSSTADLLNITAGSTTTGIDFAIGVGGLISGMITDASANPYTSGTVYAVETGDPTNTYASDSLDSSGMYELTPLRPGNYYVRANISGKPTVYYDGAYSFNSAQTVAAAEGGSQTGIDIIVPQTSADGSITGTITRENGDPYNSITVRASGVDGNSGSYTDSTDAAGNYELTGLQPGSYIVYIQENNAPRYYYGNTYDGDAATRIEVTPGATVTGINIQAPVKPFAMVQGTVRDSAGTPLSGVNVALDSDFSYLSTSTTSNGTYSILGVFPDPDYELTAEKSGYYNYLETGLNIADSANLVLDITITAYMPSIAYGKVLNASGQPLRDVSVSFTGLDVDYSASMSTDMFGDYYFPNLPPGTWQITASEYPFESTTLTGVVLAPGSPTETDLVLQVQSGRGTITGMVTDAAGNPVRGVNIRASGPLTTTQRTQADGTYQLRSLTPGTYTVSAYQESDSGTPSQSGIVVTDGGFTTGVDFNLSVYYGTLSGIVEDATGNGIFDVQLRTYPDGHNYYPSNVNSGTSGLYIVERVLTDGGLDYGIYAEKDNYVRTYYDGALSSSDATVIQFGQGASVGGIDITLPDGGGFSGTVTDADSGLPVSGTVYSSGDHSVSTGVGSSGFYEFTTLPAGDYTLRFAGTGYVTEYYDNVNYSDEATTLTLGPGQKREGFDFTPSLAGSLSGTISDASGNPLTGRVYAYQARRTSDDAFSDYTSDGDYLIQGLVQGNYYVYASVSGKPIVYYNGAYGKDEATLVAIPPGAETTNIDIVLPTTVTNGSISGRITRADGSPYNSVRVYYHGVDGTGGSSSTTTDSNGEYTLSNRIPGTYLVSVRETNMPDYYYPGTYNEGAASKVVLEPGEAVTGIDIQATQPPTARVEGVVRDQGGQPVAGVEVELSLSPVFYNTVTRADGSYAFPVAFPQNGYDLTAEKSGYFPYEQTGVNIPENQTTTLDVTLQSYSQSVAYGKVTNASGSPLPDVYVEFDGQGLDYTDYVYTDDFGDYYFPDLPPGTYRISCSLSGYDSQTINGVVVSPGSPAVNNIVLQYDNNYGVVTGRVVDSQGNPVFGVQVQSNTSRRTYTGRDGTYQLARLSAGTYTISLPSEDDSGNPSVSNVNVVNGEITTGVDFALTVAYGTISGIIRDNGGSPLMGASVYGNAVNTSPSPSSVTSGTSGLYILQRVRTDGGRDYTVRARLDGYAETYYDGVFDSDDATVLHLEPGDSLQNIHITLPPGAGFEGTITDANTGLPVTTGRIYATSHRSFNVSPDDSGSYYFDSLPPGTYSLRYQDSPYVTEYFRESPWSEFALELTLTEGQIWSGINFTPEKEGQITGTVADASGTPYTSGTVYAYSVIQGFDYFENDGLDASGNYEIDGLPAGDYYVAVKLSGKPTVYYPATYNSAASTLVTVNNDQTTSGINITVPQSIQDGTISGQILKEGGAPYSSISVRAYQLDADSGSSSATTSSDGTFTISNVEPGVYAVGAIETDAPPFYWGGTYDRTAANRVVVNPGAGVTGAIITIPDVNYVRVGGIVQDDAGNPIDGADIELDADWSYYSQDSAYDGSFLFPQVYPSDGFTLSAEKPGYLSGSLDLDLADGVDRTNLTLVLTRFAAGTLAGTVTDASGNQITDANLTLEKLDESFVESTSSDDYGQYRFPYVPQGNFNLRVTRTGYNSLNINQIPIPPNTTTTQDVVMTPVSFRGRVSGRVLDASGNPVFDTLVRSEGPYTRTTYTKADGTYVLDYLTAGTYRIYLPNEPAPGNEQTGVTVVAGETTGNVNFNLSVAYGTISGTVRDVTGTAIPALRVEARRFDDSGSIQYADTDSNGTYIIGRLPLDATGGFRIWTDEKPWVPAYWQNTAFYDNADAVMLNASNQATGIDLTLTEGASLRGRVVDTSQQPIDTAYVRAQLQQGTNPSYADNTNSNGWYAIDGLPPGTYELYFSETGYFSEYYDDVRSSADAQTFDLVAGQTLRLDADLKPTSTISGTVRSATGETIQGVRVSIRNLNNTYNTSRTTGANGEYEFSSLENGNYYLWAAKTGFPTVYYDGQPSEDTADLVVLNIGAMETVDFTLTAFTKADYDQDGDVDMSDITKFYKMLGDGDNMADINGDGQTDFRDAMDFARYWSP